MIGDSAGVHVVTLSFDDGFERSSIRTAEIFERYGLVAELNVLATGEPDEEWHREWRKGGFEPSEASFAFPYNRSTPELETWLSGRVRAFRTGGEPVMPLPTGPQPSSSSPWRL